MTCKNCGQEFEGVFCPFCTTDNGTTLHKTTIEKERSKKSKKKAIIIASISTAALTLIVGIILYIVSGTNSSAPENKITAEVTHSNYTIYVVSAEDANIKISNAEVILINTENGQEYSARTDSPGQFEVSTPIGTYSLSISAEGYEDFVVDDISYIDITGNFERYIYLTPIKTQNSDFKRGIVVEFDDIVYYADQNGLWKDDGKGNGELLCKCIAGTIASDGNIIYYSVYNGESTAYCEELGQETFWYQYDLYSYDLKTSSNKKLTSFIAKGSPICVYNNKLYYTDFPDDFTGYTVGKSQNLYSFDLNTQRKEFITTGVSTVQAHKNMIFYKALNAAGGNSAVYCYDMKTGRSNPVTDNSTLTFNVIDDKIYCTSIKYITNSDSAVTGTTACAHEYNLTDNTVKEIFSKSSEMGIDIKYIDNEFLYYYDHSASCGYRVKLSNNETTPIGDAIMQIKTEDSAVCVIRNDNGLFYPNTILGEIKDNENHLTAYNKVFNDVYQILLIHNNRAYIFPDSGNSYFYDIITADFEHN